jgi:deoxyribonuclease-4
LEHMIHVGPAGYPVGSKGPIDAVQRAVDSGFTALEMQFVRQARMQEPVAIEAGAKAKKLGLRLSAHAPYYINFNSLTEETAKKSEEWVLLTAQIAHWLGAKVIVMHAGVSRGEDRKGCTENVAKGIANCRDRMRVEGIDDVLLGLETGGKKVAWGTIEEVSAVMDQVDGVVPVIDFGHLHARSGGGMRTQDDFQHVLDEYQRAFDGPLHCHFSCIEFTEAGERKHLPLDRKQPDFTLFANCLRDSKLEVTIISETPEPEEGAKEMQRILAEVKAGSRRVRR